MSSSNQSEIFELEYLDKCPICKCEKLLQLYPKIEDKIFFAPGVWGVFQCHSCFSGILNPRPTALTIKNAYIEYYTHASTQVEDNATPLKNKFLKKFADSYREYKFGDNVKLLSRLISVLAFFAPMQRLRIEAGMRNLPSHSFGKRLLDIGCGGGDFLLLAKKAGWDVTGVDTDPKAVTVAQKKGIKVFLGGIEVLHNDLHDEEFDYITLSHVIEHVHDPISLLKNCYRLLKKGGGIWIETPNINSLGCKYYGSNWRGLEVPRHLVLFNRASLESVLKISGFTSIIDQPYRPLCLPMFQASELIAAETHHLDSFNPTKNIYVMAKKAEKECLNNINIREFITVKAEKK